MKRKMMKKLVATTLAMIMAMSLPALATFSSGVYEGAGQPYLPIASYSESVDLLPPENIRIGGNYTATTTTITWDPISSGEHAIYRSTGVYGTYTRVGVAPAGTNTWTDTEQGSNTPLSQAFYYRVRAIDGEYYSEMSEEWASRETEFWGSNVFIWSEDDDYTKINTFAQNKFRAPGTGWYFFYNEITGLRETRPHYVTGEPSAGRLHRDENGRIIRGYGTETAQFGDMRYAFFFKPGDFANVGFDVGFYTHIVGLGRVPTDTRIGRLSVTAQWRGTRHLPEREPGAPDRNYIGNSTCNFWRTMENVHLNTGTTWGVSQAAPLRRLSIDGYLLLSTEYATTPGGNWASGGFLADSRVSGTLRYSGQQQWFTRNTAYGGVTGGQWNMVHLGMEHTGNTNPTPPNSHNQGRWTNLPYAPRTVEKPFVYINDEGHYAVFVPSIRIDASGTSWTPEGNMGPGESIPVIGNFYVAKPEISTATSIENAINVDGLHVILTPGIYNLDRTINVNRHDAIVLGLGLPSLVNQGDFNHMIVGDYNGVRIAGIIFDAGEGYNSPIMLQVGINSRAYNGIVVPADPMNPIVLSDLVFRIGGPIEARIGTAIEVRRQHAIGDHFWTWRADHGYRPWDAEYGIQTKVGWFLNETVNGTVVYADDFVMYALMNEHFHEYQLLWFGEHGRLYFYQSELPYDPRTQAQWTPGPDRVDRDGNPIGPARGWHPGDSTLGFASYKVYHNVEYHQAWGIGIYAVPSNTGGTGFTQRNDHPIFIQLYNAIEVPDAPGVHIWHTCVLNFANRPITYNPDYPNTPCPIRSHPRFYSEFDGDFAAASQPAPAGLVGRPTYCATYPAIVHTINGMGGGAHATVRSPGVIHYNNPLRGYVDIYFYADGVLTVPPGMSRHSEQQYIYLTFHDPNAYIYFTLDGTLPVQGGANSIRFTEPFPVGELESVVEVRASAFRMGATGGGTVPTVIRVGMSRSNNVARFMPTRASSQVGPGRASSYAVDGVGGRCDGEPGLANRWESNSRFNQWFMVDLGVETPISEIVITWQSFGGRMLHGYLAWSNDPSVWEAPTPWVSGLAGVEGPRVLDPSWNTLREFRTVATAPPANTPIITDPPMIGVDYRHITIGGASRPRHTIDLDSEDITARFVMVHISETPSFAPSIWEFEVYARMVDTVTVEGISQPLVGEAGATTATTTGGHLVDNIIWTGRAGATFTEGEIPVATFTVAAAANSGGFNENRWISGLGAGLITVPGATKVTFVRNNNDQITVTATFAPVATPTSVTVPETVTANGLTLTATVSGGLNDGNSNVPGAEVEFLPGSTVTVTLMPTGTPDHTRGGMYTLNLTSASLASVLSEALGSRTFNLRPGGTPANSSGLIPAGGFVWTFVMPDTSVTDLELSFDARLNLFGDPENLPNARASSVRTGQAQSREASRVFNGGFAATDRWESSTNSVSGGAPTWLMVDLGAVYDITDVVITWNNQNSGSTAFQILVTEDTALWDDPRVEYGVHAGVNNLVTPERLAGWQSWRSEWEVAWDVDVLDGAPRAPANVSSYAALSIGTTALLPWGNATHVLNFDNPRGNVTVNSGGRGQYLMLWSEANGNADGGFGHSIWQIEVYGTAVDTDVPAYTITFNLYTANQRILDEFADYTIDVDGNAAIVVNVEPGTVPTLEELANVGNIYGTMERHGYAFWGWFDNETLDEAGRTLEGLRRPVLDAQCVLAYFLEQIEDGTGIFENGNINLYGVWIRWGDVDDNGLINMADLHLLQKQTNVGHLIDVMLNEVAADVVVDSVISMADLHLLQRYINLGSIISVVLGAQP